MVLAKQEQFHEHRLHRQVAPSRDAGKMSPAAAIRLYEAVLDMDLGDIRCLDCECLHR
ncbi:hypothetical protein D3C72_2520440 [compost metagenome]